MAGGDNRGRDLARAPVAPGCPTHLRRTRRRAAAQTATLSQKYSSRATLSEHTMLTHTASPVHAQWFPLILDALMADKFVDFVDAFCECSVPPK